jgi:transcription-repair coupling factor (superfamily II helicase)
MSEKEGTEVIFHNAEIAEKLAEYLSNEEQKRCLIKGLYGSSKGYVMSSSIARASLSNIQIVIEDDKEAAEYFCADLYNIHGENDVYFFPTSAAKLSKISTIKDSSQKVQRSSTISAINLYLENLQKGDVAEQNRIIIVTYPDAAKELILNKKSLNNSVLKIKKGDELPFDFIKETLMNANFERVDFVTEPGQFAVRGSIIDLFSFSDNVPYRLDFFGNNIESIKQFDINTQTSSKELTSIEIFPNIFEEQQIAEEGGESIFDYAEGNAVVWNDAFEDLSNLFSNCKCVSLNGTSLHENNNFQEEEIICKFSPQPSFNKNFNLLRDDIISRNKEGYKVFISCSEVVQAERLKTIFNNLEVSAEDKHPIFEVVPYSVHEGFISGELKICLYTDHQIFDRYQRVKINRSVERSERLTIEELNALHIGDYVVHIDHGVGIFGGLVKTVVGGKVQEAVKIMYKDGDVIFVSIHGLHRIAKYKSGDGTPPKIYRLGSSTWTTLKRKTKDKIKDIAKDLINLYAQRRQSKGFAFSGDNYMQQELEASFMYEDTPDQTTATQSVKQDMESDCPMDRLICGDVGFGKTEVAIRAAFKAVCDSKQVAILVPTTILALQHFQTFTDRLKKFPCNIDYISRLRTTKEINEILGKLQEGKIDIIIGTHRLLNKAVKFKDLGLLIIDEEQKFGVAAKERLRQLKMEVDTLTLTATPIPRTLQFSLLGARDLSIINTPPPNRLPVQTEIIDFSEDVIRDAINEEVERGGQVFFVHNRVEDIYAVQKMINKICPKVKTAVGHGQMEAKDLERIMLEFIRGDYDVLISTTIIENGIDIPNANTMIINQAQNFGLSDLHQLRGRVGRSNRRAFCYLIVPPLTSITEDARRRLKAIEAFSDLGSGFNIAMQDLDIRGAGNMLGGEQSGFIADMGFETYQRILNEAFAEINTEGIVQNRARELKLPGGGFLADCTVDTDLEAFIPDDYIPQTTEKIRLYKELDTISSEEEIKKFLDTLHDRFGEIPQQVMQLTYVVRIRRAAMRLGFERIVIKQKKMLLYFVNDQNSAYYKTETFAEILQWASRRHGCTVKDAAGKLWISVPEVNTIEQGYYIVNQILLSLHP